MKSIIMEHENPFGWVTIEVPYEIEQGVLKFHPPTPLSINDPERATLFAQMYRDLILVQGLFFHQVVEEISSQGDTSEASCT